MDNTITSCSEDLNRCLHAFNQLKNFQLGSFHEYAPDGKMQLALYGDRFGAFICHAHQWVQGWYHYELLKRALVDIRHLTEKTQHTFTACVITLDTPARLAPLKAELAKLQTAMDQSAARLDQIYQEAMNDAVKRPKFTYYEYDKTLQNFKENAERAYKAMQEGVKRTESHFSQLSASSLDQSLPPVAVSAESSVPPAILQIAATALPTSLLQAADSQPVATTSESVSASPAFPAGQVAQRETKLKKMPCLVPVRSTAEDVSVFSAKYVHRDLELLRIYNMLEGLRQVEEMAFLHDNEKILNDALIRYQKPQKLVEQLEESWHEFQKSEITYSQAYQVYESCFLKLSQQVQKQAETSELVQPVATSSQPMPGRGGPPPPSSRGGPALRGGRGAPPPPPANRGGAQRSNALSLSQLIVSEEMSTLLQFDEAKNTLKNAQQTYMDARQQLCKMLQDTHECIQECDGAKLEVAKMHYLANLQQLIEKPLVMSKQAVKPKAVISSKGVLSLAEKRHAELKRALKSLAESEGSLQKATKAWLSAPDDSKDLREHSKTCTAAMHLALAALTAWENSLSEPTLQQATEINQLKDGLKSKERQFQNLFELQAQTSTAPVVRRALPTPPR